MSQKQIKLHKLAHLLSFLKQESDDRWKEISNILTELVLEEEDGERKETID